MRTAIVTMGLVTALAVPSAASAQRRGTGSGRSSVTAPATKDSAGAELGSERDLPVSPAHGFFGAPGAAIDDLGPSRLGAHQERSKRPSYGESARGSGESYEAGKSGDRVRSASSADVRAARQQQAPDLEWASTSGAAASGPPSAPGVDKGTPSRAPHGKKAQQEKQQKPAR